MFKIRRGLSLQQYPRHPGLANRFMGNRFSFIGKVIIHLIHSDFPCQNHPHFPSSLPWIQNGWGRGFAQKEAKQCEILKTYSWPLF
jgi:hypothetical protein